MTNNQDFLAGLLNAIKEGTPKEGTQEIPFEILGGLPPLELLLKGLGKQEGEENSVNPFEEIFKGLGKQEGEEAPVNPFEEIFKGLGKQEGEETPVNPFEEIFKGLGKQEGEETPFNPLDAILKGTFVSKKEEMIDSILEKIFGSTECDCDDCAATPTCTADCECHQEKEPQANAKGVAEFITKTDDGEVEKIFIQMPLVAVSKENVDIEIEKGILTISATPNEFVGDTDIPFFGKPTTFKKFYPELEGTTFTTEAELQQGVLTLIVTLQKETKETVRVSIA